MKKLFLAFLLLIASAAAGAQTNCNVDPGACQTAPVPSDCPVGMHWTTSGSGIAHCVANTPTVISTYYNYSTFACPAGQTGTDYERYSVTKWSDGKTTYGPWEVVTYTCSASAPAPTPTCSNGATDYPTCTPPVTPTCSNGATDYPTCTPPVTPTCSNGATDYPTCTPPVTPTCSNGATDYPTCTPPVTPTCSNGATDYPTCTPPTCSNGATDYPTCTPPPPPPPPPPTCPNGASNYPTCTFAAPAPLVCPYNDTVKYSCTAGGSPGSTGKYQETKYTDNGLGNGGCNTKTTVIGTCGYNPGFWFNGY